MENSATFDVVSSGELMPGFDAEQVAQELVCIFNITSEKAHQIVTGKRVLKKGMTRDEAAALSKRLEEIGVVSRIHRNDLKPTGLSLEPIEERAPEAGSVPPRSQNAGAIVCPKCDHEQPKSDQCAACGVFFHKLEQVANGADMSPSLPTAGRAARPAVATEPGEDSALPATALVAAAAAALVGAFVWKFIAVAFEYELGLIAWAIGGAVGMAAASFGSRGQAAGVVCGVLVLLSILGGKYMAIETFQTQFSEMMAVAQGSDEQGLGPLYEEELEDARIFADEVTDESSLRVFMVDRGYTEAYSAENVGADEIEEFNEYSRPRLTRMAINPPSYEDWEADTFAQLGNVSTMEVMTASFGLLDVVFLLLGVATAFRLASRSEAA